MIFEHFPVGPLQCNCVILGDEERGEAIVVDPGGEASRIFARLGELNMKCVGIVHTHTHFDHVGGTAELQELTGAPTLLHEDDLFLYEKGGLQMQLDTFGIPLKIGEPPAIDRFVADSDVVVCGEQEVAVLHTPGHTPGSICLQAVGSTPVIASGDTLFAGGVGRTDLWRGDTEQMMRSIRDRLLTLPDDAIIVPGHGPATTIAQEKRNNPFLAMR